MSDNRVHVIVNSKRLPTIINGEKTDIVEDYITRRDGNGVSHPCGFSLSYARELAVSMGLDPVEDVIVAPDDIVVTLDDTARKLPRGAREGQLSQMSEGLRTV